MADVDYTEKFRYMDKRIEDLESDAKELRKKSDENENGKIIMKMQFMFDAQKKDSDKKELRDEKKEEKRDFALSQISSLLSLYTGKSELLIVKVDAIEEKVNILETKINNTVEKTKIDTSLWFKGAVALSGAGCVTIIILLIRKGLGI